MQLSAVITAVSSEVDTNFCMRYVGRMHRMKCERVKRLFDIDGPVKQCEDAPAFTCVCSVVFN